MHSLLAKLNESKVVLDLGCGRGSYHYEAYPFQTIGIDLHLPGDLIAARKDRVRYVYSDSSEIPFADHSIDAVISHNTLEHFPNYVKTLVEVRRVLRPDGWLWIAVPNGYGLDDTLYRFVFEGGGHVNRFRYATLVAEVEAITGLRLIQSCDLFSSFIFLHRPTPEEAQGYPRKAHFLANIPEEVGEIGVLALNTSTRLIDKWFGSRYSQYGWGFVFARGPLECGRLPSFFNVCRKCGSGCTESHVQRFGRSTMGLRPYDCPHCGELNVFVKPPAGFD